MIPFVHRIPRRALGRALLVPAMVTIGAMAIFMMREPFDPMHPKRFYAMYLENVCLRSAQFIFNLMFGTVKITSQEQHLHFAAADSAPGFEVLVHDLAQSFGLPEAPLPQSIVMDDWNADWDVVYPFSAVCLLSLLNFLGLITLNT